MTSASTGQHSSHGSNNPQHSFKRVTNIAATKEKVYCFLCKANSHNLYKCYKFLGFSIERRIEFLRTNHICFNCLSSKHNISQCKASHCRVCNKNHHSLIHMNSATTTSQTPQQSSDLNEQTARGSENVPSNNKTEQQSRATMLTNTGPVQVLLSTAQVRVLGANGSWLTARALLDSASEEDFITTELLTKLDLQTTDINMIVQGISGSRTNVTKRAVITINSAVVPDYQTDLVCSVLDRISVPLPHVFIDSKQWPIPHAVKINLADPLFYKPGNVDLLIGAKTFYSLLKNKTVHLGRDLPTLKDTVFGWVVSGVTPVTTACCTGIICLHSQVIDLNDSISKFWKLEELAERTVLSLEDKLCEKMFAESYQRDKSGKYTVSLPLHKDAVAKLGSSFQIAYKQFLSLEKRFHNDLQLFNEYKNFINEYIELKHAIYVPLDTESTFQYFMPHHAVRKPSSSSTPLRVVFNASSKTTSGNSLNDVMFSGPTLQSELYNILLRFRSHKYVFSSDISKMFRRIGISEDNQPLQSILWRERVTDPLQCIHLTTVTYGTAAAPYLATRVLHQLANDDGHLYPLAAQCVLTDFYMDDVLTGADELSDIVELQEQLVELLRRGGFELHKWASNHAEVLANIPINKQELKLNLSDDKSIIKTLGLSWDQVEDEFLFLIPKLPLEEEITKRNILSCIARFFDPIGLLGPVIIKAKIIMQKVWLEAVDWDDPISENIQTEWKVFASELQCLTSIRVPRYYFKTNDVSMIELVGFADASSAAYGACIYIRAIHSSGQISVTLVSTKTRVAPLKIISVPRLELCAVLLLAKLLTKVRLSFKFPISRTILWTDSSIVLSWLKSPASRWATFVANRVSEVHELTSGCVWRHIPTDLNPADILSRGINPSQLGSFDLYWSGPEFLYCNESEWPLTHIEFIPLGKMPELRQQQVFLVSKEQRISDMFKNYSNFTKLTRIIAWCKRFLYNIKHSEKLTGVLSLRELNNSHDYIISTIQQENFHNEILELRKNNSLQNLRKSPIINLNPFVDDCGLLRVGGRIKHANINFAQKHPLILPCKNHVTRLILRNYHEKLLHTGVDNTLASIRLRYWPIKGRVEVKNLIHHCVKCFRFRAPNQNQLMGDLPKERVEFIRPFYYVGIDFGGPIDIRQSRLRGSLITKGYIALFICMSTKAVHLELVSDLTTKAFLAALQRFISRRGRCHTIFSDNATNFRGAYNELNDLYKLFRNLDHQESLFAMTTSEGIIWKFNIPLASHMGGLWEAGIKSVKRLLKKTLGSSCLTYEEMNSLLIQIEAILNSRPLCKLSDDDNEFAYLSPAHFLIGDSLLSFPEVDLLNVSDNRLKLWERITKIRQHFWSLFYNQYLSTLQNRKKWTSAIPNLQVDTLVLVREDNVSPLNWVLARVVEIHMGKDNLVRSATVKTKTGVFKRPVNKLCPLPLENDLDEQLLIGRENVPKN